MLSVCFVPQVDEAVLALLSGVVVCCQSALAQDHPTTPPQCKETLTLLHGTHSPTHSLVASNMCISVLL